MERWSFFAAIVLALFPIWGVYYPPLLDFPEHALTAQVIAQRGYDAGPDYHGRLVIHNLAAPYSLLYVLALPLARVMPAIWAVKLVLAACLVATAVALRRLLRCLGSDPFAFYFGFPFLFGIAYLGGFIPYLLGIPIGLVLAEWLLRRPRTTPRNFLPRVGLMFLLLWAHPMAYAVLAPVLALMLLILALHGRVSTRNWLASAVLLAAPALYLAVWTPAATVSREVRLEAEVGALEGLRVEPGCLSVGSVRAGLLASQGAPASLAVMGRHLRSPADTSVVRAGRSRGRSRACPA